MAKHLKILGKGDANLLGNINAVREFIVVLIDKLGMRPLGNPVIHDVELDIKKLNQEIFQDEGGCSAQLIGFSTLSTSHCSIHCWPLRSEFHMDIYSCRDFNPEKIESFIKNYFNCYKMKVSDLTEATEW